MKTISRLTDLEFAGIVPLTGEACGAGLRILCDVTAVGLRLLSTAYGIPNLRLAEPWNSGLPGYPHVGSIMFDPADYLFLGIFALLEHGYADAYLLEPGTSWPSAYRTQARLIQAQRKALTVFDRGEKPSQRLRDVIASATHDLGEDKQFCILSEYSVYGFTASQEADRREFLDLAKRDGWTWRSFAYSGATGNRNPHMMSGRIV